MITDVSFLYKVINLIELSAIALEEFDLSIEPLEKLSGWFFDIKANYLMTLLGQLPDKIRCNETR